MGLKILFNVFVKQSLRIKLPDPVESLEHQGVGALP